jgi:hypothetical protein
MKMLTGDYSFSRFQIDTNACYPKSVNQLVELWVSNDTLYLAETPISTMTSEIFGEKQEIDRRRHHMYDDKTIESMKQYFKVEHDSDALLKYIKGNRIIHDNLA